MSKNYGLDVKKELKEQSEDDWVLGAGSEPCFVEIPLEERDQYLPVGELQKGVEDFMDCASRSVHNILETKLNYLYKNNLEDGLKKWLENNGYVNEDGFVELSDRFTAILSGTTQRGNSLKAPCDSVHNNGVIPKSMLPANPKMTWNDYHNKNDITQEMLDLGEEFIDRFKINYDRVYSEGFSGLIVNEPIDVGGYAWKLPNEKGIYQRNEKDPNHAFMIFGKPDFRIFDNYRDSFDGDWIKLLASDYKFLPYGYRVYFSKITNPDLEAESKLDDNWFIDIIKRLALLIKAIFTPNKPTSEEK